MKMLELYKAILSTGGLSVDKEGLVSANAGDTNIPFNVKGKRLVLPTKDHLTNPDWDSRVVFHPLAENVLRAESDVMVRFRTAINVRANYIVGHLLEELMTIVTSVKQHSKLSPHQAELLSKVKTADDKTMTCLQAILKAIGVDSKDKQLVNIYLKRGGTVLAKRYSRAAIVTFPLYEVMQNAITKNEKQVFGITIRTRDKHAICNLLEFIFPGIEDTAAYNKGSDSDIAPFLDSLMKGVMGIASCINTVVDTYDSFLIGATDYKYEDSWVESFDNLATLLPEIRMVPMQAGNEGATNTPAPVAPQNTLVTPNPYVAPPQTQQTNYPVQTQPIGNYNNYQQPTAPGVVKSANGGIDFAASMRNNPHLSQQFQPQQHFQMQQQPSIPRWAQNNSFQPQQFNSFSF